MTTIPDPRAGLARAAAALVTCDEPRRVQVMRDDDPYRAGCWADVTSIGDGRVTVRFDEFGMSDAWPYDDALHMAFRIIRLSEQAAPLESDENGFSPLQAMDAHGMWRLASIETSW